jgi:hypothetical protein
MKRAIVMALVAVPLAVLMIFAGQPSELGSRPALAQDADLNAIFRCTATNDAGKQSCSQARDLILENCTSCHTFAPIVMQQFDAAGWKSLIFRHVNGNRVPNLSPDEVKVIQDYLTANFNPSLPVPKLPQALLDTWTSY